MTDAELRELSKKLWDASHDEAFEGGRWLTAEAAVKYLQPIIAKDVMEWLDSSDDAIVWDKYKELPILGNIIGLLNEYLAARGVK